MKNGRLLAVVGPSGVGKDTLIDALVAATPGLVRARRVITRPPDAGGEDFEGVDLPTFLEWERAGRFVLSWDAHGLRYGIPARIGDDLAAGRDVVVNLSRGILDAARTRFPGMRVISLVARPDVLARRLARRGRETPQVISRRLERAAEFRVTGPDVLEIDNSGPLATTVESAQAALYPERVQR